MTNERVLGLNIGGTNCSVVVGEVSGGIVDRLQLSTRADRGPEPILSELMEGARALLRRYGDLSAVGVSIGGPLDAQSGTIHSPPNLPGWKNLSLKERLEIELGLPVKIEHDAAACALAEHRWGAGRGSQRLAYLTCGSGFGLGLVLDGKPYYGSDGRSIEIGHVRYRDSGPTAFGKQGSFEAFGAGNSLPRLAAWQFPKRWSDDEGGAPSGEELSKLAAAGDADAREVLELNARVVGDACALLGDMLLVDTVILGSLARYLGDPWLAKVRTRFEAQVLPHPAKSCRIRSAALGERLQDCSAVVVGVRLMESLSMAKKEG